MLCHAVLCRAVQDAAADGKKEKKDKKKRKAEPQEETNGAAEPEKKKKKKKADAEEDGEKVWRLQITLFVTHVTLLVTGSQECLWPEVKWLDVQTGDE